MTSKAMKKATNLEAKPQEKAAVEIAQARVNAFQIGIYLSLAGLIILTALVFLLKRLQPSPEATQNKIDAEKPKAKPREDVLLGTSIASGVLLLSMWTPV